MHKKRTTLACPVRQGTAVRQCEPGAPTAHRAGASKFRRTAIPADEQRGLDDLYRQTLGTKWKNQQGWAKQEREDRPAACYGVTVEPVGTSEGWTALICGMATSCGCSWTSTACVAARCLIAGQLWLPSQLVLFGNPVGGTFPILSDFLGHRKIAHLWNDGGGSIPSSLGDCRQLRTVALQSNNLTGAVPRRLGRLVHLEYLNLSNNMLQLPLPTEIMDLQTRRGGSEGAALHAAPKASTSVHVTGAASPSTSPMLIAAATSASKMR